MKPVSLSLLILIASFGLRAVAQPCANIAGTWNVHETVTITVCAMGECDTEHQSGSGTVTVKQNGCRINFDSTGINPLTGSKVQMPRSGQVSCGVVSFSGAAALAVPGVSYSRNILNCAGTVNGNQINIKCNGVVSGTYEGIGFTATINQSSTWTGFRALQPPTIIQQPEDRAVGFGSNVAFTVNASGACARYQWRHNGEVIPGARSARLTILGARPTHAGTYSVEVSNFDGSVSSRSATLQVLDLTQPSVAFLAPLNNSRVNTNILTVRGTARDNIEVALVEVSLNGGPFQAAAGTTQWSTPLVLAPGTNLITARAVDTTGHGSAPITRRVFHVVRAEMTVDIDGQGVVMPNHNGRWLEVGRQYAMTATASPGWISAGWTGGVPTPNATIRFIMEPNLVLTARFIPNPFIARAGGYAGLFGNAGAMEPVSSGFLRLTLAKSGAFSGIAKNGAQTVPFTGRFDASGQASLTLPPRGADPLILDLSLDLDGGTEQITGTIRRAGWTAELVAPRAVYHPTTNPAPFAGRYTFLVSGATDPALDGAGHGFGWLLAARSGQTTLAGTLADNTRIIWAAPSVRDGWYPLYQPLYGGKGCLWSWIQFDANSPAGFSGEANWTKPPLPNARFYPGGFDNVSQITGSAYQAPRPGVGRVLELVDGVALFEGGDLPEAFSNEFLLSAMGVASNPTPNKMRLVIQPATGLFSGWVMPPSASQALPFRGAVLQPQNLGGGLFLDTDTSGRVDVVPAVNGK